MKTLSNPIEFSKIHANDDSFLKVKTNMEMRFFISSYGFRADRDLASKMLNLRDGVL